MAPREPPSLAVRGWTEPGNATVPTTVSPDDRTNTRRLILDPRVRLLGVDENAVADIAHVLGFLRDLRHSYASRPLALRERLPMIRRVLGHREIETTARYVHLARDCVHDAAGRVADSIAENIL